MTEMRAEATSTPTTQATLPLTVHMQMLTEWAGTLERALNDMIADIRANKLIDDTLERDYDYIRHLMGRREIIVNEIMLANSRHRGPGRPLYCELGVRSEE